MPSSPPIQFAPPALLVSVSSAAEVEAAIAGGAAVIDVKDPTQGPLGRSHAAAVAEVVQTVDGRRPVTAASGDWGELSPEELAQWSNRSGAAIVKVGLRGEDDLQAALNEAPLVRAELSPDVQLAPALYADQPWRELPCATVLGALAEAFAANWLVLDTYDKQRGDLFDAWPVELVNCVLAAAQQVGLNVVLAGSLRGEAIRTAASLGPALIGLRGAVCQTGRNSEVSATLVSKAAYAIQK